VKVNSRESVFKREGKFAAIAKEALNREIEMVYKSKKKEKKVKKMHYKIKSASDLFEKMDILPSTLDKPLTYTFSKTPRSLAFTSQMDTNDKHFDFNLRSTNPDPYYFTHRNYH
jgi:hypothetical protein